MRIFHLFSRFYWHYLCSAQKEARHLGVKIGNNCLIATRKWSSEPYLITVGNNVQITSDVSFLTHGGAHCVRKYHPEFELFGKIRIDDWAYIGAHSCIMPGVVIGEGALVASGSVVTKSVAPHTVVGGNPARPICSTEEYYLRNKDKSIGRRLSEKEKREFLENLSDDRFVCKDA